MKIAWVTPISAASSIGGIGVGLAEALARRGHQLEIWASEFEFDPAAPRRPTSLTVKPVAEVDLANPGVDLAVLDIGDQFLFHAGGLEVLGRVPAVGVFHDFYLYDLFLGWLWGKGQPIEVHHAIVEATYGAQIGPLARRVRASSRVEPEAALHMPMTEWAARQCQGAIVHADFYRHRVEAACPGPVDRADLTSHGRRVPPLPERGNERLVALTVGVMNPNKRCDAVIEAIGASAALRAKTDYVLAGAIQDDERARLQALAAERGVRLKVLGPVSDAELERRLEEADLIICLRQPILEGASGSAIEAMLSGRPTVVADAGFYGELPDELVIKVVPSIDPAELTRVLEGLARDEPLRRRMGGAAAAWAAKTFTVDRYLAVLEPVLEATLAALPKLQAADRLGRKLGRLGLRPGNPFAELVFKAMGKLMAAT